MAGWIQGRVARRSAWNPTHFSLLIDCERPDFVAGQFVRVALEVDGERLARPYSCVNPPQHPGVEIFFNRVPGGPLSNRLAQLKEGDPIWLSAGMYGFMTLPEVPAQARHLWLIATGTGVGPFLSILQSDAPWQRFQRITLGYGVRKQDHYCYPRLLAQLGERHPGHLRVLPCITGEKPSAGFHGRVTEALRSKTLEQVAGCEIHPGHSHFMLCGNQAMIREFSGLLQERGLRKHLRRTPGQISSEKYH